MSESEAKEVEEFQAYLLDLQQNHPEQYREVMSALENNFKAMMGANAQSESNTEGSKVIQTTEGLASTIKNLKEYRTSQNDQQSNIDINIKGKQPELKGVKITPEPCFTIKTYRTNAKEKVFINILKHIKIDQPKMVKKLDAEGKEVEGMNIPLSISSIHIEKDKNDKECAVYDVVVNNEVIDDCNNDVKYKDFLCHLAIQSVEQKYNETLDKRYKLPKLQNNYMGVNVIEQFIQDRSKMVKIEEVSSESTKKSKIESKEKVKKEKEVKIPEKELSCTTCWLLADPGMVNRDSRAVLHSFEDVVVRSDNGSDLLSLEAFTAPNLHEYLPPVVIPPENALAIVITAEFVYDQQNPANNAISANISPFKAELKLARYKRKVLYFPCAVDVHASFHHTCTVEGFISLRRVYFVMQLDFEDLRATFHSSHCNVLADPGSKPWLVMNALHADSTSNPYAASGSHSSSSSSTVGQRPAVDGDHLPEDKFHLNLPANVDQYTGLTLDTPDQTHSIEDLELPEDKFHRKDAASSFLINQREQSRKDKIAKYEKEKQERMNDPNVEYIDMDTIRAETEAERSKQQKIASGDSGQQEISGNLADIKKGKEVLSSRRNDLHKKGLITSDIWTELLD